MFPIDTERHKKPLAFARGFILGGIFSFSVFKPNGFPFIIATAVGAINIRRFKRLKPEELEADWEVLRKAAFLGGFVGFFTIPHSTLEDVIACAAATGAAGALVSDLIRKIRAANKA